MPSYYKTAKTSSISSPEALARIAEAKKKNAEISKQIAFRNAAKKESN